MNEERLAFLLGAVQKGTLEVDQALLQLKNLPFEDIGFARIDHHRSLRLGFPEVIFCQGKTPEQVVRIMERLTRENNVILATRANEEVRLAVSRALPSVQVNELARTMVLGDYGPPGPGRVLVVSAGTADLPVAEEAAICATVMGNQVERLYDVGVAGIHRLLSQRSLLDWCHVAVVVAGMDGALPSVVGGLTAHPVVAVPTSVGYGASFGGLAALLTMLNSCAPGIAVVNIDNGYGAAAYASAITSLLPE